MARMHPRYEGIGKFECIHCGRPHEVIIHIGMGLVKGQILQPYAGGQQWGQCKFCKRGGLKAVELPFEPKEHAQSWQILKVS